MTHTNTEKPEALRLADGLEQFAYKTAKQSAAELRRRAPATSLQPKHATYSAQARNKKGIEQ